MALLRRMLATADSPSPLSGSQPTQRLLLSDGTLYRMDSAQSKLRHHWMGLATDDLGPAIRPMYSHRSKCRATRGRGPRSTRVLFLGRKCSLVAVSLPPCQLHSPSSSMLPTRRMAYLDAIGPRAHAPGRCPFCGAKDHLAGAGLPSFPSWSGGRRHLNGEHVDGGRASRPDWDILCCVSWWRNSQWTNVQQP
jgi:hypothetical protein